MHLCACKCFKTVGDTLNESLTGVFDPTEDFLGQVLLSATINAMVGIALGQSRPVQTVQCFLTNQYREGIPRQVMDFQTVGNPKAYFWTNFQEERIRMGAKPADNKVFHRTICETEILGNRKSE